MTPREKMDLAAKHFEDWFIRWFTDIGTRGPNPQNSRRVFDQVTMCIADVERKYGDTSAAPRE